MGAAHAAHARGAQISRNALCVQGRILMTHPTKAIYGTLLRDFVKVSRGSSDEALYSDEDLEKALERSEVLDFHQTIDLDGIKARPALATRVSAGICICAYHGWRVEGIATRTPYACARPCEVLTQVGAWYAD